MSFLRITPQGIPVSWDVATDITSPAHALNLAASLIPSQKGGNNEYFTDATRQVLSAVFPAAALLSPDRSFLICVASVF